MHKWNGTDVPRCKAKAHWKRRTRDSSGICWTGLYRRPLSTVFDPCRAHTALRASRTLDAVGRRKKGRYQLG